MKTITNRKIIDSIIGKARVCRLAMCDGNKPYIVPMSFGYDGQYLYFHGSPVGKKEEEAIKRIKIFKVDIREISGRRSKPE